MSVAAKPWMKFYPQDWRADEKLRMCSLSARGLWMEMLAIMHRSERYGQLLIGGRVPTDAQLAVQVGALPDQVSALVAELEEAGVFSRAAGGAIYSRRMTRDAKKAETARRNGKNGGNPTLRKQKENPSSDKGWDKAPDKGGLKAQRPEARDQKEEDSLAPKPARAAAVPPSEFELRCIRVAKIIGLTRPIGPQDRETMRGWLADELHFDWHIVEGAKAIAAREQGKGRAIGGFKYLDAGVREYAAQWHREMIQLREAGGNA